jgi:hypothetical protein
VVELKLYRNFKKGKRNKNKSEKSCSKVQVTRISYTCLFVFNHMRAHISKQSEFRGGDRGLSAEKRDPHTLLSNALKKETKIVKIPNSR